MSVWFAVPSARPEAETADCFAAWKAQGYKIALWRDTESVLAVADMTLIGKYPGYAKSVNALCKQILKCDLEAAWLVSGGDDTFPDPYKRADEIAAECTEHFGGDTYGVMQPIGDMKAWPNSRIDTICGSPWMGREFCRRIYGGHGPFCEEFFHMWSDEMMHEVCKKLGILWNREDLSHLHNHFQRGGKRPLSERPAWMVRNDDCYHALRPLFEQHKRLGWPGHDPLPA